MPPLALISATAMSTAVSVASPTVFKAPDLTMLSPMVMSAAAAGTAPAISSAMTPAAACSGTFMSFAISVSMLWASGMGIAEIGRRQPLIVAQVRGSSFEDGAPELHGDAARRDLERHLGVLLDQQDRESVAMKPSDQLEQ